MSAPFNARFSNGGFFPIGRYTAECAAWFKDGQIVRLDAILDRSDKSHNHHFAWLAEAWKNLPEDLVGDFPTPEHLRKRALVQAGYFYETAIDAGSNAAALRVATEFRKRNEFSMVFVRGPIVIIRDPMSQSRREMDGKTFQASKDAVRAIVADLIGVVPGELDQNTGRAA